MTAKETQRKNTSIPICLVAPDGTIRFSSQAAINVFGNGHGPLAGQKCRNAFNCTAQDAGLCPISEIKRNPHRHAAPLNRSNDSFSELAEPVLDSSGNITDILLSFHPDPRSQVIHSDLVKLQKLETIAEAAGGLVHDLNNIFMCMDAEVTILKDKLGKQSASQETDHLLSSLLGVISKGQGLTRHILKLSKGQKPETMPMPIGESIKEAVNFSLLSSLIQPVFKIPDNLKLVTTNSEQIFQLISNLVMNARHATNSSAGTITITADNLTSNDAKLAGLKPGEYVRITVQDQGHGIPAEQIERIFEPFYTTKPEGTGLGLSLVNLIVKELSGQIAVESTIGKGSKFTVFLPALDLDPSLNG